MTFDGSSSIQIVLVNNDNKNISWTASAAVVHGTTSLSSSLSPSSSPSCHKKNKISFYNIRTTMWFANSIIILGLSSRSSVHGFQQQHSSLYFFSSPTTPTFSSRANLPTCGDDGSVIRRRKFALVSQHHPWTRTRRGRLLSSTMDDSAAFETLTDNVVAQGVYDYAKTSANMEHVEQFNSIFTGGAVNNQHGINSLEEMTMTTSTTLLDPILQSPVFWSTAIMISIVLLLYSWEKTITSARNSLPETLQPVVNSMLVEMGGLGFVGLLLGVVVVHGPVGVIIGQFSEAFLGDANILWQSYQFLDSAFFEVAIAFFVIAGITVASVVKQVENIETVSRAAFDLNGDGVVELGEIAHVLNVDSVVVDLDGDGHLSDEEIHLALELIPPLSVWNELTRTDKMAKAEALVVRERLIETYKIVDDESFQLENYFVKIFGRNLEEMVELSPLTWLPLIPVVAQGRSIDLSRHIVSASSPNAFGSCGEFLASSGYVAASTFFCGLATVWGVWNFWKMVQIKHMLVPTLIRDAAHGNDDGDNNKADNAEPSNAVLLPPRYEDVRWMNKFNSSPFPFNIVETLFTPRHKREPRNNQEALFGAAGQYGPKLYRNSIKLHTWFVVAQLVFYSSQIVARDLAALSLLHKTATTTTVGGGSVPPLWVAESIVVDGVTNTIGRPDLLLPELALFGFYCCLAIGLLWLVPKTFLDYSLVTSIEKLVSAPILTEACIFDGICGVEEDDCDAESEVSNVPPQADDQSLPQEEKELLALREATSALVATAATSNATTAGSSAPSAVLS